jgi:Na+/H+-dicarboxylate symporter
MNRNINKIMKTDTWLQKYWRPMMSIVYMVIILFDFIVFPIFWSIVQVYGSAGVVSLQWSPLTLLSGGIFHAAMGAVLGVAAWTRGNEKIQRLKTEYEAGTNDRQ